MSDVPLDMKDQLARVDRAIEETRKFIAEQHELMAEREKLAAEREKFAAEREKLGAEAGKLQRDRSIAPWQLAVVTIGSLVGAVTGLFAAAVTLLRAAGPH